MTWDLVFVAIRITATVWAWSGFFIWIFRMWGRYPRLLQISRTIWAELRPFYLPMVCCLIAKHVMEGVMLDYSLSHAFQLLNWFAFKDIDNDDRWKRRKKKLTEKVKERAGRLVVVPAGQES
jgi:hypothetical protein